MPPLSGPDRQRAFQRVLPWIAAAVVVLALCAIARIGWHFSDVLLKPGPNQPLEAALIVSALDDSTITLSGSTVARKGETWFLEWPGGSGIVGEPITSDGALVTRRFRILEGRLAAGDRVDLRSYLYSGDPWRSLGLSFEDVPLVMKDGTCPAWVVPGKGAAWPESGKSVMWRRDVSDSTWIVIVHGMKAGRGEALRLLPVIHSLGLPSLTVTYPNDPGAPPTPDGLHHLGLYESGALHEFVRQLPGVLGAKRVILVGYSMGAALIAEFLRSSPVAYRVAGVVLDSPVLDWHAVVMRGAEREGGLAPYFVPVAEAVVGFRIGLFMGPSDKGDWQGQFKKPLPVLLFHGTADQTVPIATSEAFAKALGERVTLVKTEGAGHIQSWNFDSARYDSTLSQWLARVARDSS